MTNSIARTTLFLITSMQLPVCDQRLGSASLHNTPDCRAAASHPGTLIFKIAEYAFERDRYRTSVDRLDSRRSGAPARLERRADLLPGFGPRTRGGDARAELAGGDGPQAQAEHAQAGGEGTALRHPSFDRGVLERP